MTKNEEVLRHCPHFYTIVNFEYYSDDIISERLLDVYEKFIFEVDITKLENINRVEKLDNVLYKYITDYCFREQVKKDIVNVRVQKGENLLDLIVNAIINFFDNYESFKLRKVQTTRWI